MKTDKIRDDVADRIEDAVDDFFGEILEEAKDFFLGFFSRTSRKNIEGSHGTVSVYGVRTALRPAYIFAERVENALKVLFGISIVISALVAAFWGFTRLSELLLYLIGSFFGRAVMGIIGLSYFTVGLWKLIHIRN